MRGDAGQVENALLNLGINARDAMPDGGSIVFSTENIRIDSHSFLTCEYKTEIGEYCVVRVSDSGTGMDADTAEHIFEPFFTTKEPGKGTGLGLASVYGIVRQHSGYVTVESEPGKGATFSLFFPLSTDQIPETAEMSSQVHDSRFHILIVDDDEIIRDSTSKMLQTLGYRVTSCSDGMEAVEFYEEHWHEVDLVILDLIMPKMSGLECFRRMKKRCPGVTVLVSSGYAEGNLSNDILAEGAAGMLQKPFRLAALQNKMDEVLKGRNAGDAEL